MRDAMFVGFPEEHEAFVKEFGPIGLVRTRTLLDLAQVIAGCQIFVGNQSTPFALAEGLKKTVIQEVYLTDPNCIFERPGAQFVRDGEVNLPEV